jgi:hypothetical protein
VTESTRSSDIEPRWGVAITILAVFGLTLLPDRVRAFPVWFVSVLAIALIVPLIALHLTTAKDRWLRIEKVTVTVFLTLLVFGLIIDLIHLLAAMVRPPTGITGLQLLNSSIALWATNVLMFSIAYWWIDRGGPEGRVNRLKARQDWHFPQEDVNSDEPPEWHPMYVDYLFLAYSTATAFSTTEAVPMTPRAKLLMMGESAVSLVTVVAIASRAIGLLSG